MKVIWQSEAGDTSEAPIRVIMDDDRCIFFSTGLWISLNGPTSTEVLIQFKFAV
jgi:hypothetical protein